MFTDTLSKGLTYKDNSIRVTVNGVDVTNYFYKGVGTYDATAGTTIEVGILDLKALSLLTDPAVGEITKICICRFTSSSDRGTVEIRIFLNNRKLCCIRSCVFNRFQFIQNRCRNLLSLCSSTILAPLNIGQNAIRIITSENLVNFIGVGY